MGFFGKAIYSDGRWSEVATACICPSMFMTAQ
jgi:hypothetical protein